jgi:hypothetical protein
MIFRKIQICLFVAVVISTALANDTQVDLKELREKGRQSSTLLQNDVKKTTYKGQALEADAEGYKKTIYPILQENCLDCHGPKKSKGRFRVDTLDPDLLKGKHINEWLEVFDVLTNEEMPPEDEPDYHLDGKKRSLVVDWLGVEMNKASQLKREDIAHSSFRRMTKDEYNYALQDLFGVDFDFADELASETVSEDGFSNSSEHLKMSSRQFQVFHDLGLQALKKVTVKGDKPEVITYSIPMQKIMDLSKKNLTGSVKKQLQKKADKLKKQGKTQEAEALLKEELIGIDLKKNKTDDTRGVHVLNTELGKGWAYRYGYSKARWLIKPDDKNTDLESSSIRTVIPWGYELKLDLGNFLPEKGDMRVKVSVGRDKQKENEYSAVQLLFGGQTSNNANFIKRATHENLLVQGSIEQPQTIQYDIALSEMPRNPFLKTEKLGATPSPSEVLTLKHISNAQSKLYIDYIEIQAPIYEQWPPQSHRDIFIESKNKNNELAYASEIIQNFAEKAWCRSLLRDDLSGLMGLFNKFRPQFEYFDDAILEVLASVLASPEFIYIQQGEAEQGLDDKVLAHRLSHFLWNSIPDKTLVDLATEGELNNKKTLNQQVERMLQDPKSQRFTQSFVREWLHLEALNNVIIDKKVFPAYKDSLKEDMESEITTFFAEALNENTSIIDFLHSDYVFVNESLAKHYGISGVYGEEFRRVNLNNNYKRGGVLTASGLLAMNANGKESNPLKRGIWLLENVLHDPPPPAPPNVPEVDLTDPKILQMTLKERMEDHRNHDACRSCHAKIDPWGIALENYDALGQYRDKYKHKAVDASAVLHNQHKLDGIKGLKAYLLADRQDQFTEAMVHKMLTYALGRPLSFNDKKDKEEMSRQLRQSGDGLKDLVRIIVNSKTFLNN